MTRALLLLSLSIAGIVAGAFCLADGVLELLPESSAILPIPGAPAKLLGDLAAILLFAHLLSAFRLPLTWRSESD
jgi:hypothetical protein